MLIIGIFMEELRGLSKIMYEEETIKKYWK